jgi:hypothetical protein
VKCVLHVLGDYPGLGEVRDVVSVDKPILLDVQPELEDAEIFLPQALGFGRLPRLPR